MSEEEALGLNDMDGGDTGQRALEARRGQLEALRRSDDADVRRHATVELSQVLVELGLHQEAEHILRDALARDASAAQYAWMELASCLERQERFEEAFEAYGGAIAAGVVSGHLGSARLLAELGRAAEAEVQCRCFLETGSMGNERYVQTLLGSIVADSRPDEAERLFRGVLAGPRDEEAADAAAFLASMLIEQGRLEEAEDADRLVLELGASDLVATQLELGGMLLGRHELGEARRLLEAVVEDGDARFRWSARRSLTLCAARQGDLVSAERHLRAVAVPEAGEERDGALNDLGEVLVAQGRAAEAEEAHRAVEGGDPAERLRAAACLVRLLVNRGDLEEAEAVLRPALSGASPQRAEAGIVLAQVLLRQGRMEEAERHLRRSLSDPDLPVRARADALLLLGSTAAGRGDLAEAEDCFRQSAATGVPEIAAMAWAGLANLFEVLERDEEARAAWAAAEREEPGITQRGRQRKSRSTSFSATKRSRKRDDRRSRRRPPRCSTATGGRRQDGRRGG